MHLRMAHDGDLHATFGYRPRGVFRLPWDGLRAERRVAFTPHVPRPAARKPCTGRDDQAFARSQRRPESFDRFALVVSAFGKFRHVVVVEGEVDHSVHPACSVAQDVQVFQAPDKRLRPSRLQAFRAFLATRQSPHGVTCFDEFLYQLCPNKSGCSCDKYTHNTPPNSFFS